MLYHIFSKWNVFFFYHKKYIILEDVRFSFDPANELNKSQDYLDQKNFVLRILN